MESITIFLFFVFLIGAGGPKYLEPDIKTYIT